MADGRRLVLRSMKRLAALGDRVRPRVNGVVVLIYHRVGGRSGTEIDLPAEAFDEQMAWLAASGRVVDLDRAVELLASPAPDDAAVDTPVVVTFDDGTADLADIATPILVRHGVPATVYLATRFVEEGVPFPDDGTPLSWAAARDMAATGLVTFGSHTHRHVLLDRLPPDEAADELDRSRALVEDNVGQVAHHFAYPKAVAPSGVVEPLVRERYRSAALGGNRPNVPGSTDPHRLARTAVQVSDGHDYFVRKAQGGMALEDTIRRAANRVRYRSATG